MIALALLLTAPVMALSPAAAQSRAVDRPVLKPSWPLPANLSTRATAIEPIAACLWSKGAKDSAAFLATPLLSKEEQQAGRKLLNAHSSCIGRPLVFSTSVGVLRGALAGSRLRDQQSGLSSFARRASRTIGPAPSVDGRPFLVSYAACLATMQPGWAAAFLQAPVVAGAQHRQFLQFGGALSGCMPEGRNYQVDIAALRDEMAAVVDLMIARGDGA